ncbi:lasso peptide biosynthesis B2 protein [Nocardiopsis chromatogenes]|uniref:lasso peptide biosynthesis B2 protein n=1 Tax=Nocardiopsis chromatogenes TaxID=280239 RepID=UPI00036BA0BC|nr:lasso peptide biosynthesis B2 protein [Nocardiopsis chromatogenes]
MRVRRLDSAPPPSSPGHLATAMVGFVIALAALRLFPLRVCLALARAGAVVTPRFAGTEEAEMILAALDRVARHYPGRAACLENSLAAHLTGVLLRRRFTWCIGSRFSPCEPHAWVEAQGRPVREDGATDRPLYAAIRI